MNSRVTDISQGSKIAVHMTLASHIEEYGMVLILVHLSSVELRLRIWQTGPAKFGKICCRKL